MTSERAPRLLLVGPLPPPPTGTHISFQIFCAELDHVIGTRSVEIIDTSQKRLKKHTRIISTANLKQAWYIVREFRHKVRTVEHVLVCGSNGFLLSMMPVLFLVAKRAHKPFYVRAFGGSLDTFCAGLPPILCRLLLWTLRRVDGLSVQTALLHRSFTALLGERVHVAPGYRYMPPNGQGVRRYSTASGKALRLIFVGLVREEKGIFVLLESLRRLASTRPSIHCDIFGPIWPASAVRFEAELSRTKNATYRGVLDPDQVVGTMRKYDALVFPSHYQGEGHPGVLIEAMMAGIPAITTAFRSIPELIDNRGNGLLVSPRNAEELQAAIETIHDDRQLLVDMAKRNWAMRTRFDARQVVPVLLQQMGVDVKALAAYRLVDG